MKEIFLTLLIFFVGLIWLFGQNSTKVTDGRIYLNIDENGKIEYFTKIVGKDGSVSLTTNSQFDLKEQNHCNIYVQWLNPLKYTTSWSDSVYSDDRYKQVDEFVQSLALLYDLTTGSALTTQGLADANAPGVEQSEEVFEASDFDISEFQFSDYRLLDLKLTLNALMHTDRDKITESDTTILNSILGQAQNLDAMKSQDLGGIFKGRIDEMINVRDYDKVEGELEKSREAKSTVEEYLENLEENATKLQNIIDASTPSAGFKPYYDLVKSVCKSLIEEVSSEIASIKKLLDDFNKLTKTLELSIEEQDESQDFPGYFRLHKVDFEKGQVLQTKIMISQNEIDRASFRVTKESDFLSEDIQFRRYDPVDVFVSTGIFYSEVNLRNFGVSETFTVEMNEINANKAVTALFLNFSFFNKSDFFRPLVQLGIDPTKKNPYLLLGTGFLVPSTRFAITGGPIWTWQQELNTLKVGDTVSSTNQLEEDVKSSFESDIKGWYLGVQYNF